MTQPHNRNATYPATHPREPNQEFVKAFESARQLLGDFKSQESYYLSQEYHEPQVRQDFIDKFFIALGWDVTHERQKNPYEQEVKIENRVKTAGSQRRADYAFFVAPNFRDVKFFVEAKKPVPDLRDADDYYQTIRYGWNKGTPIAVITNFKELHILDCRYKPDIATALERKIEVYHYSDYGDEETFSKIFYLLGHDAIAGGSLEKFAETLPKPRGKAFQRALFKGGYQPVDEAFLRLLDEYRETLAKAFKKSNENLQSEELTEAVQRTLDRLVFIRFLEDKSIEEQRIIDLREQKSAWAAFLALCKKLDPKYNGLVFKPHRLIDSEKFSPPDDNIFADICDELADPTSPYDFDQIPVSILGSIYERFLGKVVHATPKRVIIEDKPEVRKAGGVYYTPQYVVRYIVDEAVGKMVVGKTPEQIAKMAFADIACGSGSFLIELYEHLLDHHTRYYLEHPEKAKRGDLAVRDGKTVLSLKKKQEILLNNIYGVDIDPQATEVTQLSLYLKLLEDVTMNDAHQFHLLHERILPDLKNNVVCGNSLIGRDISDGSLFPSIDEAKLRPINFEDIFPKVIKRGGFDTIVGNPPYLYSAGQEQAEYFQSHFRFSEYQTDFYVFFIERGIEILRRGGCLGMIVSDSWLKGKYFAKLRGNVLRDNCLQSVTVFDYPPFKKATIENSIIVLSKQKPQTDTTFFVRKFNTPDRLIDINVLEPTACVQDGFIDIHSSKANSVVISHIERGSCPIGKYYKVNRGVHAYRTDGYGKSKFANGYQTKRDKEEQVYHSRKKLNRTYFPEIKGKHLRRYGYVWDGTYISYGDWLAEPRTPEFFFNPKVAIRKIIAPRMICTVVEESAVLDQSVYVAIRESKERPHLLFLLGILASSIGGWYIQKKHSIYDTLYPWFTKEQLASFPLPGMEFESERDKTRHDYMLKLVQQMLEAREKLSNAVTDAEVNRLEILCASLDREIDQAVYEVYGLTEKDIRIIEESIGSRDE